MPEIPRNRLIAILAALSLVAGLVWFGLGTKEVKDPSSEVPSSTRQSGAPESATGKAVPQSMKSSLGDGSITLREKLKGIYDEPDYREWPGLLLDLMMNASMDEVNALLSASDANFGDSPGFQDEMKAAAYERWFALDAASALRAIDKSTMSPDRKIHVLEVFLDEWTSREPDQVSAFMLEGDLKGIPADRVHGAIVRGASLNGAIDLVNSSLSRISDPTLKSYAVRAAARQLQRDHEAMFEDWLQALPISEQGAALAESAWILSDKDIDHALANLERLDQVEAELVPVTRARVVVQWAEDDPGKAADWVASQSLQGEEREDLFANILSVWFSEDQVAATTWVEALIAKGEIDESFMNRVASKL